MTVFVLAVLAVFGFFLVLTVLANYLHSHAPLRDEEAELYGRERLP